MITKKDRREYAQRYEEGQKYYECECCDREQSYKTGKLRWFSADEVEENPICEACFHATVGDEYDFKALDKCGRIKP